MSRGGNEWAIDWSEIPDFPPDYAPTHVLWWNPGFPGLAKGWRLQSFASFQEHAPVSQHLGEGLGDDAMPSELAQAASGLAEQSLVWVGTAWMCAGPARYPQMVQVLWLRPEGVAR